MEKVSFIPASPQKKLMNKKPIYIGAIIGVIFGIIATISAFILFSQQTYISPGKRLFELLIELGAFFVISIFFFTLLGSLFSNRRYALWILIGIGVFLPFVAIAKSVLFITRSSVIAILFLSIPFIIAIVIYFRSKKDFPPKKFRIFLASTILVSSALLGFGWLQFGPQIIALPLVPFRIIILQQSSKNISVSACKDEMIFIEKKEFKSLSIECEIQIKDNIEKFIFNDYTFFQPKGVERLEQLSSFRKGWEGVRIFFDGREILSWYEAPTNISAGRYILKYVMDGKYFRGTFPEREGNYILRLLIRPRIEFEYKTQNVYKSADFLN